MFWGYNTNGLAHHDFQSGLELLTRNGYQGVALTIDHGWLSPKAANPETISEQLTQLLALKEQRSLRYVIETGARFLLNPFFKHEPTLISPDPQKMCERIEFYEFAVDCAADLKADCVSVWSGVVRDDASDAQLMKRLTFGLRETLDYASDMNVRIAFEPEPGMFISDMAAFDRLLDALDGDSRLKLTLDIGHLYCNGEPIPGTIARWKDRIVNIHLEDMRRGVHEHLPFGAGSMDFAPVFAALQEIGYSNGVYVELSRDSHRAPEAVQESRAFLKQYESPVE